MTIHPKVEENTKRYRDWVQKKANLPEEIQHFENDLSVIKAEMLGEVLRNGKSIRELSWSESVALDEITQVSLDLANSLYD